MKNPILGIVLIIVGVIAIFAGIALGIATMIKQLLQQSKAAAVGFSDILPTEWLKALTEFVTKAPGWVVLIVIGMALVAWGGTMLG
jgi:hypothetical protein